MKETITIQVKYRIEHNGTAKGRREAIRIASALPIEMHQFGRDCVARAKRIGNGKEVKK